jgi:adenosylmethionine-8-amino-7-oxononanoate aminotransferase
MANPLACAVANASIELLLNSPWQDDIARIEKIFHANLSDLRQNDKVADVRILGAIAVIEMKEEIRVEWSQKRLIELGVWLRPYGKLLYTMPPFVITDDELITITKAIKTVVEES